MFSYASFEQRVPQDHPLRAVRKLTDTMFSCAAHNLIRLPKRMAQPPGSLSEQCA
jgi:hypothetical protein